MGAGHGESVIPRPETRSLHRRRNVVPAGYPEQRQQHKRPEGQPPGRCPLTPAPGSMCDGRGEGQQPEHSEDRHVVPGPFAPGSAGPHPRGRRRLHGQRSRRGRGSVRRHRSRRYRTSHSLGQDSPRSIAAKRYCLIETVRRRDRNRVRRRITRRDKGEQRRS